MRDVVKDLGFTVTKDTDFDAFVIWYNSAPPVEAIGHLKDYQKINHFPASGQCPSLRRISHHVYPFHLLWHHNAQLRAKSTYWCGSIIAVWR